ncbi:pentapeptide repeat-containing protein [Streptomyces sp. MBT62]|uniref:pentapeptide repeat-containing protein n=1 Tax=Streptomyces sp. MBT62 TaxID=2800410 RepID=UPI00190B0536|nr:pentapeptide repeat-containing protein [Streptomyces sp. MBT62]MBK3567046.1 pentapeptide repeat-containing protein [Streptomyces sp. MBT62]
MGVLLGWCVAFAPAWIVQHDIGVHGGSQLSAADRLKAVNDVRVVLLQGAAGLVALGGIGLGSVLTLRQIRVSREGQFIDLFARAIEQLSSEQVSVRHGGTYAMEQIADAAPHYRGHVAALLASFVRQQAPWPPTRPSAEVDAERTRYTGGLRDDVGGAIAALSRRSMVLPGDSIELEKVDLRGAELVDHDLSRFCFAGANLTGCDLSHTTFTDASLRNANLTGTTLTDANLTSADLTGATGIGTPPALHHGPTPQN